MKWIVSAMAIMGAFSCQTPWKGKDLQGRVLLEGSAPLVGKHCESSALRNALLYQGYDFEEHHIPGGGGAMGFLYQQGKFPFLGGRSLTMVPVFMDSAGIAWHWVNEPEESSSWRDIYNLLLQDNPVVLRVDMRYLPYLYGGKKGPAYMSFGWHIITLYGIDWDQSLAWVSDTALPGLQSISLKDLHNARYSDCNFLPPGGNYYWVEKAPDAYSTDWNQLLEGSVEEWIGNYEVHAESENELGGLKGLQEFPSVLRSLDSSTPSYLLPAVLTSLYQWIEQNGTGGASFRQLTLDYLKDMKLKTGDSRLDQAILLMENSVNSWHRLSAEFQAAGADKEGLKNPESRQNYLQRAAEEAEALYKAEESFYLYLKEF